MPYFYVRVIKSVDFEREYSSEKYYSAPLYLVALRERLDSDFS